MSETEEKHALDETIDFLIQTLQHVGDYTTLIIGVLVGDEAVVKRTEDEFDNFTDDLEAANGFIKLGNFKRKEGGE